MEEIDFQQFLDVKIATGTVTDAKPNPKARIPAYILTIDFGDYGVKQSSAQLTDNYDTDTLLNKQIVAVINFPSKRVAGVKSEVLVLGAVCDDQGVVLLEPTKKVNNGVLIR